MCVIVDGYDKIPDTFKNMARKGKYLDEEMLFQKGFMEPNREGVWRMKQMRDVMDERVKPERVPSNILHVF